MPPRRRRANAAPTIAGTPATTATVGQPYTFTPVGDDANNDPLTYTIQNRPSWAHLHAGDWPASGTPATANIGTTNDIVITVSDGQAAPPRCRRSTCRSSRRRHAAGQSPADHHRHAGDQRHRGQRLHVPPVGSDPDGNTLTYSIQNQPSWATFSTTTGRLAGTPTHGERRHLGAHHDFGDATAPRPCRCRRSPSR